MRVIGRCVIKVEVSFICSEFFKIKLLIRLWIEVCTCVLNNFLVYCLIKFLDVRLLGSF